MYTYSESSGTESILLPLSGERIVGGETGFIAFEEMTGAVDIRTLFFLFSPLSECGVDGKDNEGFDNKESSNGYTKGTRTRYY